MLLDLHGLCTRSIYIATGETNSCSHKIGWNMDLAIKRTWVYTVPLETIWIPCRRELDCPSCGPVPFIRQILFFFVKKKYWNLFERAEYYWHTLAVKIISKSLLNFGERMTLRENVNGGFLYERRSLLSFTVIKTDFIRRGGIYTSLSFYFYWIVVNIMNSLFHQRICINIKRKAWHPLTSTNSIGSCVSSARGESDTNLFFKH